MFNKKEYFKNYYQKNKENLNKKSRAYSKGWRRRNKDKIKERRYINKEKYKETTKRWKNVNKGKLKEYARKYRELNREKIREARKEYRKKHPTKNQPFYRKFKKTKCGLCGFIPVQMCQLEVDHIDGNHKNNMITNLQTLCANCHRLKSFLNGEFPFKRMSGRGIGN